MPSQREVEWSQVKIGAIVLIASGLLVTLLFLMTSSEGASIFSHRITAYTYFDNASGLKQGATVNLEGVTIGTVKRVQVVTDPAHKLTPVRVTMRLDASYKASLRKDTKASLSTVGVLGDTVLDLNSQTAVGPPLQNDDTLQTLQTPNLQDVVKASQGTIESVNVILAKLDRIVDTISSGKGSVGELINDDTLYKRANVTVAQLEKLSTALNDGQGTIGKLMKDDSVYDHLNATTAQLQQMVNDLHAGKGSAGKLLTDDSLYNNLNGTLQHANNILAEVDSGKGGVGMMVKDPAFARKLNDTVTALDGIVTGVNSGQGTAGMLVKDPTLYQNLNKLTNASTDLVTTIRSDPKKYLTIHFKIF